MNILPPNATALEKAFDIAFARAIESIPVNRIYDQWNPHTCPADVLGYLAWAMSVDNWNPDWDENTKRSVIINALEIHRHKGTLSSVKRVLAALGVVTELKEYPLTPVPHTIEAIAYLNAPLSSGVAVIDAEASAAVLRNLDFVKPARTSITLRLGITLLNRLRTASIVRAYPLNSISGVVKSTTQSATNTMRIACAVQAQHILRLSGATR